MITIFLQVLEDVKDPVRTLKRVQIDTPILPHTGKVKRSWIDVTQAGNKTFEDKELPVADTTMLKEIDEEKRNHKATKSDDGAVPTHLWMERLLDGNPHEWNSDVCNQLNTIVPIIQGFLLRVWKRRLTRSFNKYLRVEILHEESSQVGGKDTSVLPSSSGYRGSSDG